VQPDLVWVWNGAQLPYAALRVIERSGLPLAYRVCESWFGGMYVNDVFLRHLPPGETGLRGVWARAMRAFNRLPPLRLEIDVPVPAAVSWNSEFLRRSCATPPTIEPVLEDVTLPSVARTAAFAALERRPPEATPTVLFAGRLDHLKGADVAVRALAALRDRHGMTATLVLAGSEEPGGRAAIEALVGELGLGDRVRVAGLLGEGEMLDLAAGAAAWVVPSVWDEPAGMVCTEAALARVPAVLSRVGGIPEMLREDEHALFFARGDHEGCAAALARTLGDPVATAKRVQRAFARGGELSHGSYLAAMDAFLARAVPLLLDQARAARAEAHSGG